MIHSSLRIICGLLTGLVLCGSGARAQDVFNGSSNAPTETYSSGPNTSNKTGTQGQVGNAFCPPPHEIINGQDVTPKNWSCATTQQPYTMPTKMTVARPGPPPQPGAANPCQPGGPGGYNYLDNPGGTPLPPGCVRGKTTTITKADPRYDPVPMNRGRAAPATLPPGSYLEPQMGPPGSYLQPEGKPGDYLQPNGLPGDYLNATAGHGNGTQVHTSPTGAIVLTPGKSTANTNPGRNTASNNNPQRQDTQAMRGGKVGTGGTSGPASYRQDTQAKQGGVTSNGGESYRQDTGAMQDALGNALNQAGGAARKPAAKKPATNNSAAQAKAMSDAMNAMKGFIHAAGDGP